MGRELIQALLETDLHSLKLGEILVSSLIKLRERINGKTQVGYLDVSTIVSGVALHGPGVRGNELRDYELLGRITASPHQSSESRHDKRGRCHPASRQGSIAAQRYD
jgi:hypothetical protein